MIQQINSITENPMRFDDATIDLTTIIESSIDNFIQYFHSPLDPSTFESLLTNPTDESRF